MVLTVQKVFLVVAIVLVVVAAIMFAGWVDPHRPAAWLTFGAAFWLGSQL